jgi:hypothetical protein
MHRDTRGSAGLKQHQSCAKALSVAVIAMSGYISTGKLKHEDLPVNSEKRFREIQRRYGYQLFMAAAPEIITKMTEVPRVTMNLGGKKKQVFLQVEYLEKYYNKLKGVADNENN